MNRSDKVEIVEALHEEFGRATVALLADYRGMSAGKMDRLRQAVRDAGGRCRVAKNTLTRRAASDPTHSAIADGLSGPVALILGFDDPIEIVKLAVRFAGEHAELEITGALLDGRLVSASEVTTLATLPPRPVLQAHLLRVLQAPATQLLRTLSEPGSRLVRLIDALGKHQETGAAETR